MRANYLTFGIIAAAITVAFGQNFETGDNSTVRGCSTHCSFEDDSLTCWNKTLEFFERLLLGQMRHYVAVQINVDQWHRRHDKHYTEDFGKVREQSTARIQSYLMEKDELITPKIVKTVVSVLVERIKSESSEKISWVPHFSCPLPCEHKYNTWRNLFIVSVVLNICLAAIVIPYAKRMARRDGAEILIG
uniref:Uncharacterized protein n=1 Tax=Panagrellus redivivus TaxID=6233 RepID=A0A7E4ZPT5_PANRE